MRYSLGLDIGGTTCAVLLGRAGPDATAQNLVLEKKEFATASQKTPQQALSLAMQMMEGMLQQRGIGADKVTGIGVSCGGPLDAAAGMILSPPNLIGWDHVPVADMLQKRMHIPVRLENDANACAVAEWKYGAAMGCRNAVFLTFGTGMGAGIILDGQLYRGTNNMAGEVGHVRLAKHGPVGYGKAGSFEGFCSGGGLAQLARSYILQAWQQGKKVSFCQTPEQLAALDAKQLAQAADGGDPLALEAFRCCGQYLGRGVALLVDILNPERIVLGSIYFRSRHLLEEAMEQTLRQESLAMSRGVCQVVPAALGEAIGDFAALSLAVTAGD